MKPNELRIGNYVLDTRDNSLHEVSGNTIHSMQFNNNEILKPIPLTEEWLFNFNFKKQRVCQDIYCLQLKSKLWITIYEREEYLDPNELTLKEPKKWYIIDVKFDIKIKSVHQLQNLYYAITGAELTYKTE